LGRTGVGWRRARRLARTAEPVTAPVPGLRVCQSDAIASPLIIGVLQPRVVLPRAWTEWPQAKLRAVLAHEAAHIRRHDPLISLVARVNCCLFWFHPLAWWLERQLAVTAELACDEAGAQAVGEGRVYAEVLLEMAETVRRNGGRLVAVGIGMEGRGALEQRIDRVLLGDAASRISRRRKLAIAAACLAAIFVVAGCRQKSDAALVAQAENRLRDYSEKSAKFQAAREQEKVFEATARGMTQEQVAALEASVRKNPDDYEARKKLVIYYFYALMRPMQTSFQSPNKVYVVGPANSKPVIAAALPHAFWMIEHHPEDGAAVRFSAGMGPSPFDPNPDPANLQRAIQLWTQQADRDGQPAAVYVHAYNFFNQTDQRMAEKMLQRIQPVDPKGESFGPFVDIGWPGRFGQFYAQVLMQYAYQGHLGPRGGLVATTPSAQDAAYAAEISQKLEQSKDVNMLLWAANSLVGMSYGVPHPGGFDAFALGKTLIQRALELQPSSGWARQLLTLAADRELTASLPRNVWAGSFESRHQAIEALPAGDRFRELSLLAIAAGDEGVRADFYKHDAAAEKASWQKAAGYAREALDLAPQARSHPDYGTAFFNANMVLGTAAMQTGDRKTAIDYLMKAAEAPVTDALRYPVVNGRPWPMNWHFPNILTAALFKAGERDAVLKFLDRYSRITVEYRERCLEDSALIRQGKLPSFARS
jgi:hypothetical protein